MGKSGEWFNEVHASGEQPIAEIEALRKRHVQACVEHELRAAGLTRNLPYRVEELRTDAATLQPAIDNQIVDIDEAAIQQIGQRAITGEADDASRVERSEQAIAFGVLPGHLRGERVRVRQMRAQLTHDVECGQ